MDWLIKLEVYKSSDRFWITICIFRTFSTQFHRSSWWSSWLPLVSAKNQSAKAFHLPLDTQNIYSKTKSLIVIPRAISFSWKRIKLPRLLFKTFYSATDCGMDCGSVCRWKDLNPTCSDQSLKYVVYLLGGLVNKCGLQGDIKHFKPFALDTLSHFNVRCFTSPISNRGLSQVIFDIRHKWRKWCNQMPKK